MRSSLRRLWLIAASLGLSQQALAGIEPADLLLKISEAARSANYQGVVIYRGDDALETFRVTHGFQNGSERERVQSLTGEVREFLKHDDKVICILPKDQKMTVDRPTPKGLFPSLSPERLRQIAQIYQFNDLGTSRIAGRNCRGVAVMPKDRFRYGYEVWADEETSVPLKVSLIGRDRKVLEQMFFTEVTFPASIPDSAFETDLDPETTRQVTQNVAPAISAVAAEVAEAEAAEDNFDTSALPPGFRVTMREVRPLPNGRGTVEHVLLSDGLSAISIFRTMERVPARKVFIGMSQLGPVYAYGRAVGKMHITVVGEAPQETVRMIGDSMTLPADAVMPVSPPPPGDAPQPDSR